MLTEKCFLISIGVETYDDIVIYTTTCRAFTAEEAIFKMLHILQTEYAPYPKWNAQEESQILSCEEVDDIYAQATHDVIYNEL
jgi:hypothetical protein